jgi:hypothetical protein
MASGDDKLFDDDEDLEGTESREGGLAGELTAITRGYVWMVYNDDHSVVIPFGRELLALRNAVASANKAIKVPYGTSLAEAIAAQEGVAG